MSFRRIAVLTAGYLFAFATAAIAQDAAGGDVAKNFPDWYGIVFSEAMLANISSVVATVTLIKNFFRNLKGIPALIVTMAVGLGVGLVQFQDALGIYLAAATGLLGGFAAAVMYRTTRYAGLKKSGETVSFFSI